MIQPDLAQVYAAAELGLHLIGGYPGIFDDVMRDGCCEIPTSLAL